MEENLKVVQLKGLPNSELIQQFRGALADREVEKVSIFISFKPKKQKQRVKMEKNIQQKTYEALNTIKEKKTQEQILQHLKITYKANCPQQLSLSEQISRLYEQGEYEKVISILGPKEAKLTESQNLKAEPREIEKEKIKNQYNFITFSIGNCYFRLKNYPLAIEFYQKVRQDEPSRQRAQRMNNLGTCFAIKNSYQQALKAYNEAIKYYNESPEDDVSSLLNNIAMIYLKCQMFKTAQQFFIDSINERKVKSPNNKAMLYNSYYNLGVCQKKNGRLEESINNLFIALNYASDGFGKKVDVINQICLVYEEQEKWGEALSYYEKLSQEYEKLRKPQGTIYERVSKIHERLGNALMAAKYAKRAFKLYYEQGNERKLSELSGSPLVNMPNTY